MYVCRDSFEQITYVPLVAHTYTLCSRGGGSCVGEVVEWGATPRLTCRPVVSTYSNKNLVQQHANRTHTYIRTHTQVHGTANADKEWVLCLSTTL